MRPQNWPSLEVQQKQYDGSIGSNKSKRHTVSVMIAALILVVSVAALIQFAVFSWRAAFLSVAALPVSEDVANLVEMDAESGLSSDFVKAAQWLELSPNLAGTERHTLGVRVYHAALQFMSNLGISWAQSEISNCTRFMAVVVDERLQRNRACYADLCSY